MPNIPILELFSIVIVFASIFGLIVSNNAIKAIVFMTTLNAGIITFWIALGSRAGTLPPIFETPEHIYLMDYIADPVPQAVMITAIVIGFAVTAINIIMMNTLFRKYGTSDWKELFKLSKEQYVIKDGICPDDADACTMAEREDTNA